MIRINLISEGRRPVVARKAKPKLSLGDQDPALFMLAGGAILGVLIALGLYLSVNSELKKADAKVAAAKKEVNELKPILREVEEFKKKQRELKTKIEIISDLSNKRRGPVNIMDKVSRALPDLVWIRTMDVKGKTVTISGEAMNTVAIAAFIENLGLVPEFQEPNTKNIRRGRDGRTYSYSLNFKYEHPKPPEPEAEGAEGESQDTGAASS